MKLKHASILYSLLLAALVFGSTGCTHTPDKRALKNMTPSDARTLLKDLASNNVPIKNYKDTLATVVVTNRQIIFFGKSGDKYQIILRNITGVDYNSNCMSIYDGRTYEFYLKIYNTNLGVQVADAVYVLQQAATDEALKKDESNFERALHSYQNAATKPTISEGVRRFKVQAETSVREKRFGDAAEFYESALNIAPWWPEGHFNRALVLAEVGDFETAVVEMNRYIRLAPDAPNIRAVQDNIYEWESKVPKRSDVQKQRK